ncbi:hypothetical protein BH24ACI1_BH24ACI1_06470 [soil metagenome]
MKTVLAIFLCLFFSLDAFAQAEQSGNVTEFVIEEISLARGDGNGKPGDATDKFTTTDRPIHCIIQLNSDKSATVKMNLAAVKANVLKPETKIITVNYTTKENQNRVNFTASPDAVWAAGIYRVDIFINGKLARNHSFTIENSPKEIKKEKPIAPKSLVPRKNTNKTRKN